MNINKPNLTEAEIVYSNMLWMWRKANDTNAFNNFFQKEFNSAAHFNPTVANKVIETIVDNIYG